MPQISADARDFGTVHPSTETFWPKGKENANEAGRNQKNDPPADMPVESQKKQKYFCQHGNKIN